MRVIAVDWSGAFRGAEKRIWLAEATDSGLTRLENGRDRGELAEHLAREVEREPQTVIGFDFAFSLPAWFLEERDLANGRELWKLAERQSEKWLAECQPPFWGHPGKRRPDLGAERDQYRRTDREVPSTVGIRPKSVFQIGGAGAVGTGSLRGMPVLRRLEEEEFSVWPFGAPGWPLVVEIYPRLLTKAVNKSDATERASYLRRHYEALGEKLYERAVSSEDAFDAAVSALVMRDHLDDLTALPDIKDEQTLLEGLIWHPEWRSHAALELIEAGEPSG